LIVAGIVTLKREEKENRRWDFWNK